MVKPITPPNRIAIDSTKPMTRLDLLEEVNNLNIRAFGRERYWTVTILYNTVIYRWYDSETMLFKVIKGIPK